MKSGLLKSWLILFCLQVFASLLVFSDFLTGKFYFAYLDIGSDSYFLYLANALHLARSMALDHFSGWSFHIGLGGPTAVMFGDLTSLLSQAVGVDNILPTRFALYLLKMALGGAFFLLFIRFYVRRWESAVISALAYSFCGFMVINGQWDIEATAFVFYPLVLWAIGHHLRTGGVVVLPLVIAITIGFGTFFVSLGVFLTFSCAAAIAYSDAPKATMKAWILRVFPLIGLGYLLAGPYLLPVILQLMDSSRVSGAQSLIQRILSKSLGVSDWALIIDQIGGIFHKDIFGIGNNFKGYFNYLEAPGFFIGVALLLLIPQLSAGSRSDKKALLLAAVAFVAYIIFPVFRYAAMGFAAPYFRISTLWISMLGLALGAKAIDQVFIQGIRIRLLTAGLAIFGLLLALVVFGSAEGVVWKPHLAKVATLAVLSFALLMLAYLKLVTPQRLPFALMLVVLVEIVTISRPSFVYGRHLVSPSLNAYDDKTPAALAAIKHLDAGIFRIEKDYNSVSFADALAQDYMGIKSYSLHSRGVVDFEIGTGLIPPTSKVLNYSNWLPNAGPRYMLNSLLSVKYFIAANAINWPGFVEVDNADGLRIYRNDMALPFGIVQTQQVTKETVGKLSAEKPASSTVLVDAALINAVVVDHFIPGYGSALDIDVLAQSKSISLEDHYFSPVAELQKTGLQLKHFSNEHITGSISPTSAGVLVFSIPFSTGWTLKLDGQVTPMFRANFGMLAAPVLAGVHTVELTFETPGRRVGWALGALGLGVLLLTSLLQQRAARTRDAASL